MTAETSTPRVGLLHWTRDSGLSALSVALLLGVAGAGWTGSFIGLHGYAMEHMQLSEREAWLVPLAFDGAAFGLSIAAARAASYGRSAIGSRLLVVAFTMLSSWINWMHVTDPQGRLVAALLPPAAVVLFEAVLAEMRAASERRSGRVRPRLHPLRWIVDPHGTWALYRSWILDIPLPGHLGMPPTLRPVRTTERAVAARTVGDRPVAARAVVRPADETTDRADEAPWPAVAERWDLDRAMLQIALDADAAARRDRNRPAGRDRILDALRQHGHAIGSTGAQTYQRAVAAGRDLQAAERGG